jgi:ferredoxin-NADP reductase
VTDIPLWVPIISAGAAVLGASVSPVAAAYHTLRQARHNREYEHGSAVREACTSLFRAARDLRAQVANNHAYHAYQGTDMGARLERVRELDADVAVHAAQVAMLESGPLGDSATGVAAAVGRLIIATEAKTKIEKGVSAEEPNFKELDASLAAFRSQAVNYFRN